MTTQIDVCNRALLSIGARAQISSINPSDGSTEANACSVLFAPTFEALGRSAHWNCLRKQVTLTLLKAAEGTPENPLGTTLPQPATPWLYGYLLPSDCLQMRFIVPSLPAGAATTGGAVADTTYNNVAPTWLGVNGGQIPFQISYDTDTSGNPIVVILSNQDQAQAVYTVNQPNPLIWDSQFQAAMVASLAAYLVPALSLNMPLMQASVASAERVIMQARVSDGNEGVTTQDHVPDWIHARGARSFYGWGAGGVPNAYYANMVWPAFGG